MIRLVEPPASREREAARSIASAARGALGADAVLIVELGATESPRVLATEGLSEAESDRALAACTATPTDGSGPYDCIAVPGFPVVMYKAARVPAVGAAAVCALQRHAASFKNAGLAGAFAQHVAVSCGARRHARQHGRGIGGDGALNDLGIWHLQGTSYGELHRAIADEVRAATGASTVGVLVWDEETKSLRPVPGAFGTDPEALPPAHAAHDWGSSAARVFATGEPYLTNHAAEDPGVLPDYVETFGVRRLMALPMDVGGRRIGVLEVANKPVDFTMVDLHAAAGLGRRIAAGVQVARMHHVLLRRQRLEEILGGVAVDIASGRSLQEFLGEALDSLCAAVNGSLIALVSDSGEPVLRRRGPDTGYLERMVLGQARQAASLRVYGVGPRRAGEPGWSAVHVPVALGGEQVATLSALRRGGESFDHDECRAFSRLAHLVALAWATEHYQRQLADSARVAERQRIADALHDQVAQLLFAARLSLDFAMESADLPDAAKANVQRGRDLLLRADAATREVMQQNSHAEDDRLSERLAELVGGVEEEFARPVQLEIEPMAVEAARSLSRPAMNLLARAAREALVNAAKHAGPCQLAVRVTVTRRHRLLLTVTDGGIGVAPRREDGYGTAALRRAVRKHGGALRVAEASTGGTKVAVSLPL